MTTISARPDLSQLEAAASVGMTTSLWAKITPDRVAVYDPGGRTHTFAKINANANRLARLFREVK
mgnify:CR=1 FL=1